MNQDIVLSVGAIISQEDVKKISQQVATAIEIGSTVGWQKVQQKLGANLNKLTPSQRVAASQATIFQARQEKYRELSSAATAAERAQIELKYANLEEAVRTAGLNPARRAVRAEMSATENLARVNALTKRLSGDLRDTRLGGSLSKQILAITNQRLKSGLGVEDLQSATDALVTWNLKQARRYNIAANAAGTTLQQKKTLQAEALRYAKTAEALWGDVGADNPATRWIWSLNKNTAATEKATKVQAAWLTFATSVAGKAVVGAAEYASFALPSIWNEAVTRNVMASRHAQLDRYERRAGIIGNVAGYALGGAVGGVALGAIGAKIGAGVGAALGTIAPGIGNVIGATAGIAIGGAIGAGVGKLVGPLLAAKEKADLARKEATRDIALNARRDFYLYGGKAGHSFGKMLEDSKLASASSYNQMRWTGETLPGAMAFGMLGEQDMLMLSLMPEYYAALMNGESGSELAAAYQRSANNLPTMLRPLVATSVPGGSQDMYSASQDPLFSRMYWDDRAGLTGTSDTALVGLSEAMLSAAINVAARNIMQQMDYVRADAAKMIRTKDLDFYDTTLVTPRAMQAYWGLTQFQKATGEMLYDEDALKAYEAAAAETHKEATTPGDWTRLNELVTQFSRWTDKTFNINVMLNGNQAAQTYLTIDSIMTETQTNIVGSLN